MDSYLGGLNAREPRLNKTFQTTSEKQPGCIRLLESLSQSGPQFSDVMRNLRRIALVMCAIEPMEKLRD